MPAKTTRFGASVQVASGETFETALARLDRDLGRLEVLRIFYTGMPEAWTSTRLNHGRDMLVSFKLAPAEVLAGKHDAALTAWFQGMPGNVDWSFWHEPEDDIERGTFTAEAYRRAWTRITGLARANAPTTCRATLILMAWSLDKASGRYWRDYYAADAVDMLGWDTYGYDLPDGSTAALADRQAKQPFIEVSRREGKPWCIAELGLIATHAKARPGWLRQFARDVNERGAQYVCYFFSTQGGDFRLSDAPSLEAYREATTGTLWADRANDPVYSQAQLEAALLQSRTEAERALADQAARYREQRVAYASRLRTIADDLSA